MKLLKKNAKLREIFREKQFYRMNESGLIFHVDVLVENKKENFKNFNKKTKPSQTIQKSKKENTMFLY